MKRNYILFLFILIFGIRLTGQQKKQISAGEQLKSVEYADPGFLLPPPAGSPGFPVKTSESDLLSGFKTPPPGYGEVPFWWWSGDSLNKERLLWEIEELHKKGINGMQVNYIHRDSPGWPTWTAEPEIFSEKWWGFWKYAADEAGKRSMGIGMSGYTIDWPKSDNLYNRLIYSIPEIQGEELAVDTVLFVKKGKEIKYKLPSNLLQAWLYDSKAGKTAPGGRSLSKQITNGILHYKPAAENQEIWIFKINRQKGTINPMNPLSGKTVIEKFYQQFENHTLNKTSSGLNYFFQDELKFGVGNYIWTDDFDKIFSKDKGYSAFEILPALFKDIGSITPKARLDFMDVKVRLSEERYFKPIFLWHWERGMIYGCDPEGRGKEPGMYGNNFQAIRWYTAPGHDTPSGKADLIKGKVSSSIAALYKRPRVWLEGYHSLGWGATPGQIMFATNENYLYGCNLLNLHGLYYTTHGSYWEWAPPCYHFRMPYWDHMTIFLNYFERLSYLLSQGVLQSDIAILYPVSTAQSKMNEKESAQIAFQSGTDLFTHGYDFTFIDDQSVIRSEISKSEMKVSDMSFKILVLPAMKAIRWSTINRALDFFQKGGTVIATSCLPEASDNAGREDPELNGIVRQLFGKAANEMVRDDSILIQKNKSGGLAIFIKNQDLIFDQVSNLVEKHVSSKEKVKFMHRKVGSRNVYMVMGASKGSWCTFNTQGKAEYWNAWTGNVMPLYEIRETPAGTMVKMPGDSTDAQLIVFTPGQNNSEVISTDLDEVTEVNNDTGGIEITGLAYYSGQKKAIVKTGNRNLELTGFAKQNPSPILLDGDWGFELKPTMDNRWGDFRLPVVERVIGAEARKFRYSYSVNNESNWILPSFSDSTWSTATYGYGRKFWELGPLPDNTDKAKLEAEISSFASVDPGKPVIINGKEYKWKPYSFSWRMGFEGDPGHEGYHGLKEQITDEFICLGKPVQGLNETTYKAEKDGSVYYLWTSAYSENEKNISIDAGGLIPSEVYLNGHKINIDEKSISLNKGSNPLLIRYDNAGRGHFVMLDLNSRFSEKRTDLSMKWFDISGRIPFDIFPEIEKPVGIYRFVSPPGLKSMIIRAEGVPRVWLNGIPQVVLMEQQGSPSTYSAEIRNVFLGKSLVVISIENKRGYYDGAAFPEPVLLNCISGVNKTGDWAKGSVLENYSGGAWYRKKIEVTKEQSECKAVVDLGDVVATAEIHINDSLAAVLITSPWRADITKWLNKGENKIEILVYNTLANHYLTVPTKYGGNSLLSGLIGPVKIEFYSPVKLK